MDRRIIWFALILILVVSAIFIVRRQRKTAIAAPIPIAIVPNFSINPTVIQEGDSIHFEDQTVGATSWRWDFSDGAGGSSSKQSGNATYYSKGIFTIRLAINDSIRDSTFVEVRAKNETLNGPIKLPPQIAGPQKAYVDEPVTFTDKTPGAENTEWQNFATAEIKRHSNTYTTTFKRKGTFTIVATNEKNTGQGIHKVTVIDRPKPLDDPKPNPIVDPIPKPLPKEVPPPIKRPSDAELKRLFNYIVTGKDEFTAKYRPIKNAIGSESVPVIIKGTTNTEKKLYGFCQYLNMSNPTVLDVRSEWDAINGYKTITVTVKDNN